MFEIIGYLHTLSVLEGVQLFSNPGYGRIFNIYLIILVPLELNLKSLCFSCLMIVYCKPIAVAATVRIVKIVFLFKKSWI